MLAFATFSELREWGRKERSTQLESHSHQIAGKTVFLSHSSQDNDLLAGAAQVLENHGGRVYVDVGDASLCTGDCTEIAERLRKRIGQTRRFVMLATPKSKDSLWIPWELGLADGIHGAPQVALFPSAETWHDMEWSKREYLGLYRRIVWGDYSESPDKIWMVIDHRNNEALPLEQWLKGY